MNETIVTSLGSLSMNSSQNLTASGLAPRATTPADIQSWVRESMRLDTKSLVVVNEGEDEERETSPCSTRIIVAVAPRVFHTFSVPRPLCHVTHTDVIRSITTAGGSDTSVRA